MPQSSSTQTPETVSTPRGVYTVWHLIPFFVLGLLMLPPIRLYPKDHQLWLRAAYLFAVSFLVSFILVPLLIYLGYRTGLVDKPDQQRKHHAQVTPTTGGVAIYLSFVLSVFLNFHFSVEMKVILLASTAIFITGILDDRFKLSAKIRLLIQIAAALLLIYFGIRVTFVPPWLGGIWTETVITLIWIIGITNSMNFIDGMDGLAGGTAVIYALFFALIAGITWQVYMMFLAVSIAGACFGFFPYNFRNNKPAKVFLGDAGSTFLGFLLASFAIWGEWGDSILDISVPILIMSVLIFDMTLTTFVRIKTGEVKSFTQWLHYTGRDHFHHRLAGLGLGKRGAAGLFFAVSLSFCLEALALLFSDIFISVIILLHSILIFVIIGIILVLKSPRQPETENALHKEPI